MQTPLVCCITRYQRTCLCYRSSHSPACVLKPVCRLLMCTCMVLCQVPAFPSCLYKPRRCAAFQVNPAFHNLLLTRSYSHRLKLPSVLLDLHTQWPMPRMWGIGWAPPNMQPSTSHQVRVCACVCACVCLCVWVWVWVWVCVYHVCSAYGAHVDRGLTACQAACVCTCAMFEVCKRMRCGLWKSKQGHRPGLFAFMV